MVEAEVKEKKRRRKMRGRRELILCVCLLFVYCIFVIASYFNIVLHRPWLLIFVVITSDLCFRRVGIRTEVFLVSVSLCV